MINIFKIYKIYYKIFTFIINQKLSDKNLRAFSYLESSLSFDEPIL